MFNAFTNLSEYVFRKNAAVTSISLPDSLISIDSYGFENCYNLESINLSDNISTINNNLFSDCTSLLSINLPKNLIEIGDSAFSGCNQLSEIKISDEIDSLIIQGEAFSETLLNNETVTKLAILAKGTIYSNAFSNLGNITEVTTSYVTSYYF